MWFQSGANPFDQSVRLRGLLAVTASMVDAAAPCPRPRLRWSGVFYCTTCSTDTSSRPVLPPKGPRVTAGGLISLLVLDLGRVVLGRTPPFSGVPL